MAANDISLFRGDDKTYRLTVTDKQYEPINLSTYNVLTFTVKVEGDDPIPLIQKKSTISGEIDIVVDPVNQCLIYLEPEDTATLCPGDYVYDVEGIDASAKTRTLVKAVFTVEQDVTN